MSYRIAKYEASGNDFILVEGGSFFADSSWAVALCDRKHGIGGDGLLVVLPNTTGAQMIIYNADGSRPEMCGNGVRCVAAYLYDHYDITDDLTVLSDAGPRRVTRSNREDHYTVFMGKPTIDPLLTVNHRGKDYPIFQVNMGNPHAIIFAQELLNDVDLNDLGLRFNHEHPFFPEGVNLEIVKQSPETDSIECRVYERGVGETLACGTGACAVAVAAIAQGIQEDKPINVRLPGGPLQIEWLKGSEHGEEILMTGPAHFVAEVTMSDKWVERHK